MKIKLLLIIGFLTILNLHAQIGNFGMRNNYSSNGFVADCFPDVYGGTNELKRFLRDNLIYPREDIKAKKQGKVMLGFVVTNLGKTVDIKVVKSVSIAADKEAIRLLKLIDWMPAYKNNEAISIYHYLEVNFSISKYKKHAKERGFDTVLYTNLATDTSLTIYEAAEQMPIFNSADTTFIEFIQDKIEYPEHAVRQHIEGDIKLTFVVEPSGKTSNIKIINAGLAGGCNNEAIRVVALSSWLPAIKNNKYVRYKVNSTINFSLKRNHRSKDNFAGNNLPE